MRIRTALASAVIASMAVVGITVQAAHAASWVWTGSWYGTKSQCVDDGQQYEREGWPYKCIYSYVSALGRDMYWLYIYE
jgi:hypothetical protein